MITDETDALIEKIAHALGKENYVYGPNAQALFRDDAVAVLPIVEAEARKAKAEALDEFAAWAESLNDKHPRFKAANDLAADMAKRFRADNYPHDETGGSDDHR